MSPSRFLSQLAGTNRYRRVSHVSARFVTLEID